MARTSIKAVKAGSSRYKQLRAKQAVARASAYLRGRAPPANRGFWGVGSQRGRDELKTIDTGTVTYAANDPTNGNFTLLNGVATGTDYTNRIGRKVIMKSLLIRGQFYNLSTGSDSNGDLLRLMVICDEQPNGAAPIITDILQTADHLAPLNLNNRGRFKVLYDKMLNMPAWTTSAGALVNGSPRIAYAKIFKKMTVPVIFNGTGSTVGSIQTNSVYIVTLATNNQTAFSFNSRIRFMDS
jgi:hypothetical protein